MGKSKNINIWNYRMRNFRALNIYSRKATRSKINYLCFQLTKQEKKGQINFNLNRSRGVKRNPWKRKWKDSVSTKALRVIKETLLTRLKKGKEERHTPPISWMKGCNRDSTDLVEIKRNIMSHCILINYNTLMKWANSLTDTNYQNWLEKK